MSLRDLFEAVLNSALEQKQQKVQKQRGGGSNAPSTPMPHLDPMPQSKGDGGIGDVMRSVVQVVAMRQGFMGGMQSAWTGSGTIVHPQGIILTNCTSPTRARWGCLHRPPIV